MTMNNTGGKMGKANDYDATRFFTGGASAHRPRGQGESMDPNDPDTQANIVQAHRDLVRDKAQRASVERDPSNLFPAMLRNLATMIEKCENMYDDRDDTRMPTEDSDAIVDAIKSIADKVGDLGAFRSRGVDACQTIAASVTEIATVLAGRLRVLDLMLEQDGYIVCPSCNGHGTVYIEAADDDATCNHCRGRGYTEPDEPAPNRWRNVEGDTWWRPDADCHVFSTAADDAWWWALGSGDSLRCGSEGTREEAMQTADNYIAGMWAERIQDPAACPRCYDTGVTSTTDGEAMDCDCAAGQAVSP